MLPRIWQFNIALPGSQQQLMPPHEPLDLKRLRSDALRAHEARPLKASVGTFAAVRAALPEIRSLRADGVSWDAIAAALADQGVVQGKGETMQPITRARLTAVVTQLEQAEKRKATQNATRVNRRDLSGAADPSTRTSSKVALSRELDLKSISDTAFTGANPDEEALRRQELEDLQAAYTRTDDRQ